MPGNNQRGFTLLELMVTIGTVALLFAIALPQYTAYKQRAALASAVSNCRTLYHAFTVFYLENDYEYPSNVAEGNIDDFELDTLFPLNDPTFTGEVKFAGDIEQLNLNVGGDPNDRVYFTDVHYQQYYLIMPWSKDPNLLLVVASSDNVTDKNGNLIDGGNWLDGVFIWNSATNQIMYQ